MERNAGANEKKTFPAVGESLMAEKVGFEPTDRLLAGLPDFERNYFALLCTLKTAWHGTMDIHRRSGYTAERRTPMWACQIPLGTVF